MYTRFGHDIFPFSLCQQGPKMSLKVYELKLKCGECLCIAHELRVKIVNFNINYLCIGTVEKFEINLAYK